MKLNKYRSDFKGNLSLKLIFCVIAFFGAANSTFAIGVCTTLSYNTGALIPVGVNPRQIVTGDLNGDTAADMVVLTGGINNSNAGANILLNDGRGAFTLSNSLAFNFAVNSILLADFNQDGAADLAVAGFNPNNSSASQVVIYFNNGNGNFTSQTTFNAPGSIAAFAAGDFNADGAVDIVAASSTNNSFGAVSLFLNTGFGNFTPAGNTSVAGLPRTINVADFNGDGRQDVVTINNNSTGSIIYGTGTGGFQLASNFSLSANSSSIFPGGTAVGDFNNDRRPDLVIAVNDSNQFIILINNGTGGFGNPVAVTFPLSNYRLRSVTVGQFVGDGNLDIAFGVNSAFGETFSLAVIVPGNGNGTFAATNLITAPTGATPLSIVGVDFNRDGRDDIAAANSGSNDVSVLLNNGADRYGPNTFPVASTPSRIAVADFNGDGDLDTAVGGATTQSNVQSVITVSLGNGRGGVSGTFNIGGLVNDLIAADLNNDGRPELIAAAAGANNVVVYPNAGSNSPFNLSTAVSINVGFVPRSLAVGDFNKDGRQDIIAGSLNSNSIALIAGAANGTFAPAVTFAAPVSAPVITAGDFNRDGNLDLAVAGTGFSGSGGIFVLLGSGRGTFSQAAGGVAVINPTSITSGDFNNDSLLDVAVTNASANFNSTNAVTVAFGTGDGNFGQTNSYAAGTTPASIVSGDFNGDARPDLIVVNSSSNSLTALLNSGNGTFGAATTISAGIYPLGVALGDFNEDGRSDVVTANSGGNNFSILTNSCREAVTKTDYTGEGRTDFSVFRPSNGAWYVLDSNGGDFKSQQFGLSGDMPAPGDYDGDGETDFAVFRPSNSTWYILRSSTNRFYSVQWGTTGDVPVANDFDGDGRTDIAVWRPSNGVWYVIRSATPNQFFAVQFGVASDRPVAADYDGDGRADIAVYRGGNWIILQSSNSAVRFAQFGIASDVTVPGDYDGDGRVDLAVYRGGNWYILQSSNNVFRADNFGLPTDRPQPGDYDGDGKTDLAVIRPSENNWYVLQSSNRQFRSVNWGSVGDVPVSSIYRY